MEPLKNLFHLDFSHNIVKNIHGLQNLRQLTYLHIGMNQIEDISYMPTLSHLKVLDINNNKVGSAVHYGYLYLIYIHISQKFVISVL